MEAPAKDFLDALKMRVSLNQLNTRNGGGCALIQSILTPEKRLVEVARVLVCLNHVARFIVKANHGVVRTAVEFRVVRN